MMRRVLVLALSALCLGAVGGVPPAAAAAVDLVLVNGKIVTVDRDFSVRQAVAIKDGKVLAVGGNDEIRRLTGAGTRVVDLGGRTVIPGLIDSHFHGIRTGLTYDLELSWVDVRSIAEGLDRILAVAARTRKGTWIRVAGGWHERQFAERRVPTREELDRTAPDHPVFLQRLYESVTLNTAGLKALAIGPGTADPPRAKVERDADGHPTGVVGGGFFAVQGLLARLPRPTLADQIRSTRNWFTELNRVGLTAIGDVAGGGLNWPDDYRAVNTLHERSELTVRVRWYMQPNQPPGKDIEVIRRFIATHKPGSGDDWMRPIGFGEAVTFAVFDGDAFTPNPPTFTPEALAHWGSVVRLIIDSGWRFQMHSTRDNSARQLLPALEEIHKQTPLDSRRLAFAHLEDVSVETMQRMKAMGGGITVQDRLIYGGEDVLKTLGPEFTRRAPPLKTLLAQGVPIGGGTDATRVAPYLPFWSIWWMVTGKTVGGQAIRSPEENLSREEALRVYTLGSAWFNLDEDKLGSIEKGKLADLVVLTGDYLTVPEDGIRDLASVLTIVGGNPVWASGPFAGLVTR
jgi:predicted amidohydrolase YtcJ